MLMKEIIDQIDDVVLESEIDVLQAMSDVYDKAQIILENSDTTDGLVPSYAFFQEGEIMDRATGKGKNESTIKKIAAFLPRLIMAIVDFIKKKFTKKETPVVKYTKDSFEKLTKEVKEKGTDSPLVKGLIAAGAATVAIGAGGAIIIKIKRRNKDNDGNDGNNEEEIIINPPDGANQKNDSAKPDEAEKPEEASVQIISPRYVELAAALDNFNKSMKTDDNGNMKSQAVRDNINNLINTLDEIGRKEHLMYNDIEEYNAAIEKYVNAVLQTGDILSDLASSVTEFTLANKENESIVTVLNEQCRGPLNNLMKRLQDLENGHSSLKASLTELNNVFNNLARMKYQWRTTNVSDDKE